MKNFFIETFGCQMNFADSEVVASILKDKDYNNVSDKSEADIILINTCSIRENAEQKVYKRLRELRSLKKGGGKVIIGVIGCMAERLKEKLIEKEKVVDLIAGPDAYRDLPNLIDNANSKLLTTNYQLPTINVALSEYETYDNIMPYRLDNNKVSAFVSIMRGCDKFCTYCVVPYTRGRERSREPQSIINEAKDLFDKGYREVTLLGQNVNSYKYEYGNDNDNDKKPSPTNYQLSTINHIDFADLLEQVAEISPLLRVRFSTSHPKDFSDKLIQTIAKHDNICNAIHLPVQSGSDRILKMMNRKYTRESYSGRISMIKSLIPGCTISTDIITGFCTETEEEHQETLSLMEWAGFDYAYMFKYSERPDTPAARKYHDDITEEIKTRRLDEIIKLQQKLSHESNKNDLFKTTQVLIENASKRSSEFFMGRNSQNKVVILPQRNYKIGDYVMVKITKITSATLFGEPVEELTMSNEQ